MINCPRCLVDRPDTSFYFFKCCKIRCCKLCAGNHFSSLILKSYMLEGLQLKCPTPTCKTMYSLRSIRRMKLPYIEDSILKPKPQNEHSSELHQIILQMIHGVVFLLNTVFYERCPNCDEFIEWMDDDGNSCITCSQCKSQFCIKCYQFFNWENHPNQNACCTRRIMLSLYYVLLIYTILLKSLRTELMQKAYDYLYETVIKLGISTIYVIAHAMWWYWYKSIRNINKSLALLSFLGLLTCEILINHAWFTYSLFQYMYDVFILSAVIVELLAYLALMDSLFLIVENENTSKLLYVVLTFIGIVLGIFSMAFNFKHTASKIMVLLIPYDMLSSILHLNSRWHTHWLIWVARLILISISIYIIYVQHSRITAAISLLIMTANIALTYNILL
jgi:hypothetical protein